MTISSSNETKLLFPILLGNEARTIDLNVTEKVGRIRILESVATRIADVLHYYIDEISSFDSPLLFIAGKGNNGANAMACARILHLRGFTNIRLVTLFDPSSSNLLRPNITEQLQLFHEFVGSSQCLGINNNNLDDIIQQNNNDAIIIDGILGTGIQDPPRGIAKQAIQAICSASTTTTVVSIDMPSGLNHVTGETPGVCVMASHTINLHMLKSGQLVQRAKPYIGQLWSVESALGFITFPEPKAFQNFYKTGPIQKVNLEDERIQEQLTEQQQQQKEKEEEEL